MPSNLTKVNNSGVWLEKETLSWKERCELHVGPGDALVEVLLSGICGTDLGLVKGYYPFTGFLGHEFVGVVRGFGEDVTPEQREALSGRRVCGDINITCAAGGGRCRLCESGLPTHCERRKVLGIINCHGCHSRFLVLPPRNLHCVPGCIPSARAVFAEPLAAALQLCSLVHVQPSSRVLILGAGRLGLLIMGCLSLTSCELSVVCRHDKQRHLAALFPHVRVVSDGDGGGDEDGDGNGLRKDWFDVVVEATGNRDGFSTAVRCVRPRGTIALKSTYPNDGTGDPMCNHASTLTVKEVCVQGSRCGDTRAALRLMRSGVLDQLLDGMVDGTFARDRWKEAFEVAGSAGALKVLLTPVDSA